jgi:hypothetical protein
VDSTEPVEVDSTEPVEVDSTEPVEVDSTEPVEVSKSPHVTTGVSTSSTAGTRARQLDTSSQSKRELLSMRVPNYATPLGRQTRGEFLTKSSPKRQLPIIE